MVDEVVVFHGGPIWEGQITYFTDNFRLAAWYGRDVWVGVLDLRGDKVVVEHEGRCSGEIFPTHARHCNYHVDDGVLISLNVHDHGEPPPYPPELLANVYSTRDTSRFCPIALV